MINFKINERGVTLLELLATLALLGLIGTLAYSVLFQGYANYERIQAETRLRDEADLIMANFIREMFVLNSSEAELSSTCVNGSQGSCIKVTKEGESIPSYIGFQRNSSFSDVAIVNNNPIQFYSEDVRLVPNDFANGVINNSVHSEDGIEYTVRFVLSTEYRGKSRELEFVNTINLIEENEVGS